MPKQHMKNPNPRSIEPLCGGWSMASDGPIVTTAAGWSKVPSKDRCGHCDKKIKDKSAKAAKGRRK